MSVEQRLAVLERSARRWRFGAIGCALTLIVVVSLGAGEGVTRFDSVFAKSYTILNPKGEIVGNIRGDEKETVVVLFTSRGPGDGPTLNLRVSQTEAKVTATAGDSIVDLSAQPTSVHVLGHGPAKSNAFQMFAEDGGATVGVNGPAGARALIMSDKESAYFHSTNRAGKEIWTSWKPGQN